MTNSKPGLSPVGRNDFNPSFVICNLSLSCGGVVFLDRGFAAVGDDALIDLVSQGIAIVWGSDAAGFDWITQESAFDEDSWVGISTDHVVGRGLDPAIEHTRQLKDALLHFVRKFRAATGVVIRFDSLDISFRRGVEVKTDENHIGLRV